MKSLKRLFTIVGFTSLLFFTSCFDTIEEFTINADGTGSYTVTMDMYKMMEMMMSMGGEEKMKNDPEYNEVKDSTFFFKDVIKDVPDLTEEEKALFKDARFDMHMAMKEKAMNVKFTFPVTKYADFGDIFQNSMKASTAIEKSRKSENAGDVVETENAGSGNSGNAGDAGSAHGPKSGSKPKATSGSSFMPRKGGNDFMRSSEMYKLDVRDGYFSKQVISEKFKEAMEKDSTIKMMGPMLKDATISTVIHFPRKIKKVSSDKVILSEDKKTITLKVTMGEYLEHPESMNIVVEY